MLIQKLPEPLCRKLTAAIRMKHHPGRHTTCPDSILQRGNGKIGINPCRQTKGYDFAGRVDGSDFSNTFTDLAFKILMELDDAFREQMEDAQKGELHERES